MYSLLKNNGVLVRIDDSIGIEFINLSKPNEVAKDFKTIHQDTDITNNEND